jgi:hypothetical protein
VRLAADLARAVAVMLPKRIHGLRSSRAITRSLVTIAGRTAPK